MSRIWNLEGKRQWLGVLAVWMVWILSTVGVNGQHTEAVCDAPSMSWVSFFFISSQDTFNTLIFLNKRVLIHLTKALVSLLLILSIHARQTIVW
jgi:hypothetical protein